MGVLDSFRLDDKVVIVTGVGPGMGLNSELGNMRADVKDCGASGQ